MAAVAKHRKWMWIFLILFFGLLFLIGIEAEGRRMYFVKGKVGIEDTAGILAAEEELMLAELLSSFTDYCDVLIYTQKDGALSAEEALLEMSEKYRDQYKKNEYWENAVLFYIDDETGRFQILAAGEMAKVITRWHGKRIVDAVAQHVEAGEYYTCIAKAAGQAKKLFAAQGVNQAFGGPCILLLAAFLAVLLTFAHVTETAGRWGVDKRGSSGRGT